MSNQTEDEQVVELTIDSKTQIYDTEKIVEDNSSFKYLQDLLADQRKAIEK